MRRVLYIGHYNAGSTSRMRGEIIKDLLVPVDFVVVNIDVPLAQTPRILRSIGWRFKIGPLISNINRYILECVNGQYSYDIVWIDKGVFIDPDIILKFRSHSKKLIHFTPDPAFTYHRSHLFFESINLFDYCITTKSYELDYYGNYGVKTLFCTQGFDPNVHKPYNNFQTKSGVVFIGHKEDDRELILAKLIEAGVQVTLAGNHWKNFANKRRHKTNLTYKGKGVFGECYAQEISKAHFGLGFLSKWIPELHTTRTFEIPACRTALITENNQEINSFFSQDEAIYYDHPEEVLEKISFYLANLKMLEVVTENGYQSVIRGGYDYLSIIKKLLSEIDE